MISEMLKLDLEGKELLDMGCGTAVLAILARLKGAKRVAAIDIDEWAYNNAFFLEVSTKITYLFGLRFILVLTFAVKKSYPFKTFTATQN